MSGVVYFVLLLAMLATVVGVIFLIGAGIGWGMAQHRLQERWRLAEYVRRQRDEGIEALANDVSAEIAALDADARWWGNNE